jgi:Flp pilus assembly protein TadG
MRTDFGSHAPAARVRQARRSAGGDIGRRAWSALVRCAAGNVAVEFALAVPVLLFLMMGSAEMARFVLLHQKLDRVATTVSDLVSRAETISESQVVDIFTAVDQVAEPFDFTDLGVVIVSSITNTDGTGPVIAWQRSGGGAYSATSALGAEGATPVLPSDFVVREGETAIISEVYYDFTPFLSSLIVEPQVIYRTARNRPRLGTLDTIDPG